MGQPLLPLEGDGISTAPWTFVRLLDQVLSVLQWKGLLLASHIDDVLLVGETSDEAASQLLLLLCELKQSGFLVG